MLSITMLTAGLFTLDRARLGQERATRGSRVIEMRTALESAVLQAGAIYRNEATCDPVLLQNKLSHIEANGSVAESSPTRRTLNVTVNSRTYSVHFGSVSPLKWTSQTDPSIEALMASAAPGSPAPTSTTPVTPGVSQDAEIEVWTSIPGFGRAGGGQGTRTTLRAVLINTCVVQCNEKLPTDAQSKPGDICLGESDESIRFHPRASGTSTVSLPSGVPVPTKNAMAWTQDVTCTDSTGTRKSGDIPLNSGWDNRGTVNAVDYVAFDQYLQSGNTNWLNATSALAGTPSTTPSCADLNLDGQLNEVDRTIMLKWLRGYIFRIPVSPTFR